MIDPALTLLRLLLGLGALFLLGYAWLALLVPQPREFRRLERLALSFGIGATLLTLWMLVLTWLGLLFSLILILVPPLALAGAALLVKKDMGEGGRGSETPCTPPPNPLPQPLMEFGIGYS